MAENSPLGGDGEALYEQAVTAWYRSKYGWGETDSSRVFGSNETLRGYLRRIHPDGNLRDLLATVVQAFDESESRRLNIGPGIYEKFSRAEKARLSRLSDRQYWDEQFPPTGAPKISAAPPPIKPLRASHNSALSQSDHLAPASLASPASPLSPARSPLEPATAPMASSSSSLGVPSEAFKRRLRRMAGLDTSHNDPPPPPGHPKDAGQSTSPNPHDMGDKQLWIAVGIIASAFITVFGVGLYGFYDNHYFLGSAYTLAGFLGIVAVILALRGHKLTTLRVAIAALGLTWAFFAYDIYDRNAHVRSQFSPETSASENAFCFGGPCPKYDGTPLGFSWESDSINARSAPPQIPLTVTDYGLLGKNVGQEPVNLKDAYVVSEIDGTKLPLKIYDQNNQLMAITEAGPVPVDATFRLSTGPLNESEVDFLRTWGTFTVVVDYDGGRAVHTYGRNYIQSQIDLWDPNSRPHVTRRKP